MQKDDLKDILQQHASGFEIKPASTSFEKVMQRRSALRNRKRAIVWSMAASVVVASGLLLFLFSPSSTHPQLASAPVPEVPVTPPNTSRGNSTEVSSDESSKTAASQPTVRTEQNIVSSKDGSQAKSPDNNSVTESPARPNNPTAKVQIPAFSKSSAETNNNRKNADIVTDAVKNQTAGNTFLAKEEKGANSALPSTIKAGAVKEGGLASEIASVAVSSPASSETTKSLPFNDKASAFKADSLKDMAVIATRKDSGTLLLPIASDSVPTPLPMVQNNEPQYKWKASVLFTPQVFNSVYNANSEASLGWMKQYLENREQNDKALYSFNAGLRLERQINKRFSVSTALLYSVVKFEEIRKVTTTRPDTSNQNLGTASNDPRVIDKVNQTSFDIEFKSLEVPVQLYYTLRHKKMYYQATAGVSYSYLFETRSLVFDADDSLNVKQTNDAKNKRLQQHNLFILGGINVGYQMNERWSCYAGPVMRYGLNSIYSKDYIIRQRPYYVGVEMGVAYVF